MNSKTSPDPARVQARGEPIGQTSDTPQVDSTEPVVNAPDIVAALGGTVDSVFAPKAYADQVATLGDEWRKRDFLD